MRRKPSVTRAALMVLVGAHLYRDSGAGILADYKARVEEQTTAARKPVSYGSPGCGLGNTLIALQTAISIAYSEGRPLSRPLSGRVLKDKVFSRYFSWPASELPTVSPDSLHAPVQVIQMKPNDGASSLRGSEAGKRLVVSTCWWYDPAALQQRAPPLLQELLARPTARTKQLIGRKRKEVGWEEPGSRCSTKVGVHIRTGVDNGAEFHRRGFHKMTAQQVDCALKAAQRLPGPVCYYFASDNMADVRPTVNLHPAAQAGNLTIAFQEDDKFMHSAYPLSESEEDRTMADWLILGEADILYGTGTSFSLTAANRTGTLHRHLPYKDYHGCQEL